MKNIISPFQKEVLQKLKSDVAILKLAQDIIEIHNKFIAKIDEYSKQIDKKVGPKGDKGDSGKTPNRKEIIDMIRPLVAEQVSDERLVSLVIPFFEKLNFNEEKIIGIVSPYIDEIKKRQVVINDDHIDKIAEKVSKKIKPREVKVNEIDPLAILEQIMSLPEAKHLDPKRTNGMEQTIHAIQAQLKRGYLHGGGIANLLAGSGIIITPNGNGTYTVSLSGGGATWYEDEVPSGTKNGVNVTFLLAHTPTSVVFLFLNGQRLISGVDYTRSVKTITMTMAPLATDVLTATYS